jgi:hypothetical protein
LLFFFFLSDPIPIPPMLSPPRRQPGWGPRGHQCKPCVGQYVCVCVGEYMYYMLASLYPQIRNPIQTGSLLTPVSLHAHRSQDYVDSDRHDVASVASLNMPLCKEGRRASLDTLSTEKKHVSRRADARRGAPGFFLGGARRECPHPALPGPGTRGRSSTTGPGNIGGEPGLYVAALQAQANP